MSLLNLPQDTISKEIFSKLLPTSLLRVRQLNRSTLEMITRVEMWKGYLDYCKLSWEAVPSKYLESELSFMQFIVHLYHDYTILLQLKQFGGVTFKHAYLDKDFATRNRLEYFNNFSAEFQNPRLRSLGKINANHWHEVSHLLNGDKNLVDSLHGIVAFHYSFNQKLSFAKLFAELFRSKHHPGKLYVGDVGIIGLNDLRIIVLSDRGGAF